MKATPFRSPRLLLVVGLSVLFVPAQLLLVAEEPYVHWVRHLTANFETLLQKTNGRLVIAESPVVFGKPDTLAEYNLDGQMVNTRELPGIHRLRLAADGDGNTYWTGQVGGPGVFDYPTVQGFFIAKFDPQGQMLWVRNDLVPEAPLTPYATQDISISVDRFGNVAVGGGTSGTLQLGAFNSESHAEVPFLCKLDPSGNLIWGKAVSCPGGRFEQVQVDGGGHVVVGGVLAEGTADFGGVTLYPGTAHGYGGDLFLAKYGTDGEVLWATLDYGPHCSVNAQGEIYVSFNWSKDGVTGIAKLASNGDPIWHRELPLWWIGDLTLDPHGDPVFTGSFGDTTINLDGITLRPRSPFPYGDIFVAKADEDGRIVWAIAGGGPEHDEGQRVVCDTFGNIFLQAWVRAQRGTFDGLPTIPWTDGNWTPFVARLTERPPMKVSLAAEGVEFAWPGKATNYVLEAAHAVGASWTPLDGGTTASGRDQKVTVRTDAKQTLYRLRKP